MLADGGVFGVFGWFGVVADAGVFAVFAETAVTAVVALSDATWAGSVVGLDSGDAAVGVSVVAGACNDAPSPEESKVSAAAAIVPIPTPTAPSAPVMIHAVRLFMILLLSEWASALVADKDDSVGRP